MFGLGRQRQTVRAEVNPYDLATVVSIYPKKIDEKKPTIQPGHFIIEKGSPENPALLIVGPSSWWREVDVDQPFIEISNSSIQVANSIVNDYCNGLLGCNMRDVMPGIFWIPGEFKTFKDVTLSKFAHKVAEAVANQRRYWETLVKIADIGWIRTQGNPLSISEDMKLAASMLNLKNKPWMGDFTAMTMIPCTACGHMRNPNYPICANCHTVIDKDKAKELKLDVA